MEVEALVANCIWQTIISNDALTAILISGKWVCCTAYVVPDEMHAPSFNQSRYSHSSFRYCKLEILEALSKNPVTIPFLVLSWWEEKCIKTFLHMGFLKTWNRSLSNLIWSNTHVLRNNYFFLFSSTVNPMIDSRLLSAQDAVYVETSVVQWPWHLPCLGEMLGMQVASRCSMCKLVRDEIIMREIMTKPNCCLYVSPSKLKQL